MAVLLRDIIANGLCVVNSSMKFINYFSLHMFTWNNRLVPHVYLMSINEINYNSELEERFQEEAMILNSLATDLWKEFQSFVRAYRFHTEYCGTPYKRVNAELCEI